MISGSLLSANSRIELDGEENDMGVYIPNIEKPKSCWECFNADCNHWGEHGYENSADCPIIEIDIVRCGECKWCNKDNEGTLWCEHSIGGIMKPTDFCSYGERRADE